MATFTITYLLIHIFLSIILIEVDDEITDAQLREANLVNRITLLEKTIQDLHDDNATITAETESLEKELHIVKKKYAILQSSVEERLNEALKKQKTEFALVSARRKTVFDDLKKRYEVAVQRINILKAQLRANNIASSAAPSAAPSRAPSPPKTPAIDQAADGNSLTLNNHPPTHASVSAPSISTATSMPASTSSAASNSTNSTFSSLRPNSSKSGVSNGLILTTSAPIISSGDNQILSRDYLRIIDDVIAGYDTNQRASYLYNKIREIIESNSTSTPTGDHQKVSLSPILNQTPMATPLLTPLVTPLPNPGTLLPSPILSASTKSASSPNSLVTDLQMELMNKEILELRDSLSRKNNIYTKLHSSVQEREAREAVENTSLTTLRVSDKGPLVTSKAVVMDIRNLLLDNIRNKESNKENTKESRRSNNRDNDNKDDDQLVRSTSLVGMPLPPEPNMNDDGNRSSFLGSIENVSTSASTRNKNSARKAVTFNDDQLEGECYWYRSRNGSLFSRIFNAGGTGRMTHNVAFSQSGNHLGQAPSAIRGGAQQQQTQPQQQSPDSFGGGTTNPISPVSRRRSICAFPSDSDSLSALSYIPTVDDLFCTLRAQFVDCDTGVSVSAEIGPVLPSPELSTFITDALKKGEVGVDVLCSSRDVPPTGPVNLNLSTQTRVSTNTLSERHLVISTKRIKVQVGKKTVVKQNFDGRIFVEILNETEDRFLLYLEGKSKLGIYCSAGSREQRDIVVGLIRVFALLQHISAINTEKIQEKHRVQYQQAQYLLSSITLYSDTMSSLEQAKSNGTSQPNSGNSSNSMGTTSSTSISSSRMLRDVYTMFSQPTVRILQKKKQSVSHDQALDEYDEEAELSRLKVQMEMRKNNALASTQVTQPTQSAQVTHPNNMNSSRAVVFPSFTNTAIPPHQREIDDPSRYTFTEDPNQMAAIMAIRAQNTQNVSNSAQSSPRANSSYQMNTSLSESFSFEPYGQTTLPDSADPNFSTNMYNSSPNTQANQHRRLNQHTNMNNSGLNTSLSLIGDNEMHTIMESQCEKDEYNSANKVVGTDDLEQSNGRDSDLYSSTSSPQEMVSRSPIKSPLPSVPTDETLTRRPFSKAKGTFGDHEHAPDESDDENDDDNDNIDNVERSLSNDKQPVIQVFFRSHDDSHTDLGNEDLIRESALLSLPSSPNNASNKDDSTKKVQSRSARMKAQQQQKVQLKS